MGVHTHTDMRSKEHVGSGWQLLPGIPNEITLDLITPKLPWKTFHILSCVSRCWREAIQTKQVYKARVRANSTETLIVHLHFCDKQDAYHFYSSSQSSAALALYSTSAKCCYELPPIPCPHGGSGNAMRNQCIALDGKLYAFEGERLLLRGHDVIHGPSGVEGFDSSGDVFVLDLAGQREWKQCARMLEARSHFSGGVMDGKIYIFGGSISGDAGRSEMYDPQENAWSPIMPMPVPWIVGVYSVATVGQELFLYQGDISPMLAYNPAKNEWRLVEHSCEEQRRPVFADNDKFYSFSRSGIDVYDVEQQAWINLQTDSFVTIGHYGGGRPVSLLAVKDELLMRTILPRLDGDIWQSFQSKGFDTDNKEMVWQRTDCSNSSDVCFKCSIQL